MGTDDKAGGEGEGGGGIRSIYSGGEERNARCDAVADSRPSVCRVIYSRVINHRVVAVLGLKLRVKQ